MGDQAVAHKLMLGGTPREKAEPGRDTGRKSRSGRNAGRKGRSRDERREKGPKPGEPQGEEDSGEEPGTDPGEQDLDSESPGGSRDKTRKMTFSPPSSRVFPCGVMVHHGMSNKMASSKKRITKHQKST